jgi:hypothetical protein
MERAPEAVIATLTKRYTKLRFELKLEATLVFLIAAAAWIQQDQLKLVYSIISVLVIISLAVQKHSFYNVASVGAVLALGCEGIFYLISLYAKDPNPIVRAIIKSMYAYLFHSIWKCTMKFSRLIRIAESYNLKIDGRGVRVDEDALRRNRGGNEDEVRTGTSLENGDGRSDQAERRIRRANRALELALGASNPNHPGLLANPREGE